MNELENKIALITGAKGGLGNFVTKAFLDAGATVAGSSRSIEDKDFPHAKFVAFPAELSNLDSAQKLVDSVIARFGRIDALVHLVGAFEGGKPVAETDDGLWHRLQQTNFLSALSMFRAVIPHMRKAGSGRIIAIGSRAAVLPKPGIAAYSVSKAALLALVRAVALENKDAGITANIVMPGTMDTPANRAAMPKADASKWVPPAQVADLLVYLSSGRAASVNGAAVPVYGGEL